MEEKEYTIKEAIPYLAERGRVISERRLSAICELSDTPKEIIKAQHTHPQRKRPGLWFIRESELDKLIARGNKRGNPTGFNQAAREARWHKNTENE
jgi:hypothetical protein